MVKELFQNAKEKYAKNKRVVLIAGGVIAVIAFIVFIAAAKEKTQSPGKAVQLTTHTVTRGDLVISVAESGNIKAIDSTDLKSEVEGRTSIISIVDEGTIITEEDVKNGKILVELDSSSIRQTLAQQEVTFSNEQAGYEEAKESLAIQIKQNESDIKAGELNELFAQMDFKKFLGETLANILLEQQTEDPNRPIDYEAFLANENLGGEALKRLKELSNDISITESELNLAKKSLEGTERLFEKEYVAEMELIADRLDVQSLEAKMENAIIALNLYKLYEFPKQCQELLENYHETARELDRIKARARSRLAQEEAKLRNREATYNLQKEQLEKYKKQYAACTIEAPVPGQVVYGSSLLDNRMRDNQLIEIGAEVYERQRIISIPDTSQMKVEIKVHETWIGKVQPGQEAIISISAFPDQTFHGTVLKKAPLADPENWRNPDLKVYTTDVSIDGDNDEIKTGMSARVEVIISRLRNVLTVPIQAVVSEGGQKYCYLNNPSGAKRQPVETGQFNANFVEIKSGLREGDKVLLNPPRVKDVRKEQRDTEPNQGVQPQEVPQKEEQPSEDSQLSTDMPQPGQFDPNEMKKWGTPPEGFDPNMIKNMKRPPEGFDPNVMKNAGNLPRPPQGGDSQRPRRQRPQQ
jgi:HlyD family secretion protein